MSDAPFSFAPLAGRFRDPASGRFVSEARVREAVDAVADLASSRMAALSARWRAGELTTAEWISAQLTEIKAAHIASALAAYGGREQMTPERWGLVGQMIRREYGYARAMADDVLLGRQPMNGRLDARAAMYGQAARTSYENIRRREEAERGQAWEENHLHASESCSQCRAQTALGRVPIGTLVPVGGRTCRARCRCTLSYGSGRAS